MRFIGFVRWALIVMGIISAVGACGFAVNEVVRIRGAELATGEVIAVNPERGGANGATLYRPTVRFLADRGPVTITGSVASNPPGYRVGESVRVYYDRAQPTEAIIDSFMERWLFPVAFGGFGIFAVAVGVFLGWLARREARRLGSGTASNITARSMVMRLMPTAIKAFGVMFVLIACGLVVRDLVRTVGAASATGEVIALTAEPGGYLPTVRFVAESGPVTFTGMVASSPPAYTVGQPVHVYYDRADPSSALIDSFLERMLLPLIFGAFGIIALAIGTILGWRMRRRAMGAA